MILRTVGRSRASPLVLCEATPRIISAGAGRSSYCLSYIVGGARDSLARCRYAPRRWNEAMSEQQDDFDVEVSSLQSSAIINGTEALTADGASHPRDTFGADSPAPTTQ